MEPLFTIRESAREGLVYLALAGEVDLAAVPELRDQVTRHLGTGATGVVIDLSAVTFLDSSGIGVLLECRRLATDAGRTYRAVNAQGNVAHVLSVTGVTDILAGIPAPASAPTENA